MGFIYVIVCLADSRVYVGSARRFRVRRRAHWSTLRSGKHENARLQAAWDRYGEQWITASIVEVVPDDGHLVEAESRQIAAFDAFNPAKGYNIRQPARASRTQPVEWVVKG